MTLKQTLWAGCLLGAQALIGPAAAQADGHKVGWWIAQAICPDNCAGVPKGAQPAPVGTYVNKYIQVQESKAETDDFVFYKHMWYRGGTDLGPLGRYQLNMMTARLKNVPFPVVIETSLNEKLDEQRRDVIVALLKMRGYDDPSRVVVAFPIAEGLFGDEAPRIYNGLIGLYSFYGGGLFGNNFGYGGFGGFGGFGGNFGGFGGFGF
jgi:hypothetical protein